jgi:Protein of unknown function (DUF2752)
MSVRSRLAALGVTTPVLVATSLWCACVLVLLVLQVRGLSLPTTCTFKRCPTCGSTRTAAKLLELDVVGALAFNPLSTLAILAAPLVILLFATGLRPKRLPITTTTAIALATALLIINWCYLVWRGV